MHRIADRASCSGGGKTSIGNVATHKINGDSMGECSIAKLLDHNLSQLGWSKSMPCALDERSRRVCDCRHTAWTTSGFCWRRAFRWRGFFRAKVTKVIQTNEVSVSYRTLEKAFLQVVPVVGSDRCSTAGTQALCGAFLVVQRLQAQERALSSERSAFFSSAWWTTGPICGPSREKRPTGSNLFSLSIFKLVASCCALLKVLLSIHT